MRIIKFSSSFANNQLTCYWCPDLNGILNKQDGTHFSAKVTSSHEIFTVRNFLNLLKLNDLQSGKFAPWENNLPYDTQMCL